MVEHYNPTAYIFVLELTLSRVLFYLLRCVFLVIEHESHHGTHSVIINDLLNMTSEGEPLSFLVCNDVLDGSKFALHLLRKFLGNQDTVQNMHYLIRAAYNKHLEFNNELHQCFNMSSLNQEDYLLLLN